MTETKNDIDTMVNNVYNTFVSKGIPVVVGEYGVFGWDSTGWDTPISDGVPEHGEMLKFMEYSTSKVRKNKLTPMMWDNGGRFDRTTLQWEIRSFTI